MSRLYELQAKLADQNDVHAALRDVLAVACEFTGTDRGCVQLLSPDGERLEMAVWQGYPDASPFINFFRYEGLEVGCEVARVQRQRMIIEETEGFAGLEGTDAADAVRADGIRASQSTPLTGRSGETIGVLSTQFRQPHRCSDHQLRLVDMLAWTAAEFLERHRASAAQREADARMQKAFSAQTVGVLFFSLDGGIQDANATFTRLSGYTRDELRAVNWETLTPPEFWDATSRAAAELAETGETAPYEKQLLRKDGSRWWGLFAPTRLSGSGPESQCVEFIIDITDRKQSEEALRESEERLRLAIDAAEMGTWEWHLPTDEVFWSEYYFALFGMEPRPMPLVSDDFFRHVHPGDRERIGQQLRQAIADRSVFDAEFCAVLDSGENRWMNGYGRVTVEVDGRPVRMSGVMLDITERKRAEAQLKDFAAHLEQQVAERTAELRKNLTLLQQTEAVAQMGSWAYTPATGEFEWSEGMYGLFDLESGTPVRPETYLDFSSVADRDVADRIVAFLKQTHPNGQNLEEVFRIHTDQGEKIARIKATVLRNEAGNPERVLGVDVDITAQVVAERQVAESAAVLRNILDGAQAGIVLLKALRDDGGLGAIGDFVVESTNQLAAELNGIPMEQTIGHRCSELFPHYKALGLFDRYVEVVKTGQRQRFEVRNEGPGLVEWFDVSLVRHEDGLVLTFSDISARKKAELRVQSTADQLQSVLNGVPAGISLFEVVRNAEGKVVDFKRIAINQSAAGPARRFSAEIPSQTLLEKNPGLKTTGVFDRYRRVFQTGEADYWEIAPQPGGSAGWYAVYVTRLVDTSGVVVTVLDITDRKRAELLVQETADQLRTVLDTSQASITLLKALRDGGGRIHDFELITSNRAAARFLGVSPDYLPGRRLSGFPPEFLLSGLTSQFVEVIETHTPQRFEWYHQLLDRWLNLSLARQDDGVVVTALDITASKRLQFSYQHQAELLQGILDSTANALGVYDALRDAEGRIYDFKILLFNRAALEMAALTRDDVAEKTLLQISPHSKETGIFDAARDVVETGRPQWITGDDAHLGKSFSITLSRFGAEGLIVGSVDITPIREAQRQQEQLLDELRRSNANLEQFAYVTSHDLQEPLRKIQSFGQMLLKRLHGRMDDTEADYIRRMQDAAGRMKALIEDLLTFSRLSAKKEAYRWFNLNVVVREVLADLESVSTEKNAHVEVSPLPRIKGDAMQWRQLLQNLISNALKFNRTGVRPEVRVTARTVHGSELTDPHGLNPALTYHEITVADNGIGFDDQYREKIFEMFQRLHGRAEYDGTGIGLAIAKKVAEQHGGDITAHSRLGEGATFRVYVPTVPSAETRAA